MNKKNEEAREMLCHIKKVKLGFFPTPIHHLVRLSKVLGVEIYLKRDDYAGISQFGGNKIRKLEYLLAEAVNENCDTVITYGASQSNHAMQTAAACNRLGLKPVLYLVDLIGGDDEPKANMILDKILGAQVHLVNADGQGFEEGLKKSREKARRLMHDLEGAGHKCYEIPMGGANAAGTVGFVEAFLEMTEQMEKLEIHPDHLFHASGSGGTLAGLAAGKILSGASTIIHGVSVGISHERYKDDVSHLANEALERLGSEEIITTEDFLFHEEYGGPGYEKPSRDSEEAMKLLARTEGIFLDPVYTAKAFSGMLDQIRSGKVEKGSAVLFWHTGGVQALFAEKEILGDLI